MTAGPPSETVPSALSAKPIPRFLGVLLALALLGATMLAASATAAPGAYRVLIVFNNDGEPKQLREQIAAEPGVAAVDIYDADVGLPVPSPAQLASYDLVVDVPDFRYADEVAYGNALADYLDAGGVLVQFAYDNWLDGGEGNGPEGRFASGGYAPFIPGENENDPLALGSFDAASPLMQGVGLLTSGDNTAPGLAPGATLVASWNNGVPAIAYKGSVVSVSAYTGGEEFDGAGEYGRLAVNAVRWLGQQTLSVNNANPAGGLVSSTAGGILCSPHCTAFLRRLSPVILIGAPAKGHAFAGFAGACSGSACNLTMDGPKTVSANFYAFGGSKKLKRDKKKGTGSFSFAVGGPGKVVVTGKRVKKRSKAVTKAGRVAIPLVAKGRARDGLGENGKAKVGFRVTFTPTGGAAASFTKTVTLRLALG